MRVSVFLTGMASASKLILAFGMNYIISKKFFRGQRSLAGSAILSWLA